MDEITGKIRNVLNQNIWYHGTTYSNWESFCSKGVIADYNKDTSDALDFGYGFYLATTKERAEHFIVSMMRNSEFYSKDEKPMILGFEFIPMEWFKDMKYQTKIFYKFDDEFAEFVFGNRTENV